MLALRVGCDNGVAWNAYEAEAKAESRTEMAVASRTTTLGDPVPDLNLKTDNKAM